jgi:glucose/arabinose dehydrogenase
MKMRTNRRSLGHLVATPTLALLAVLSQTTHAQTLDTIRVASGLTRPLFVTAPKNDFNRLFIVEQFSGTTGRIRILNLPANTLNATPFLSVASVSTGNEQGLLGLAFHPNFLNNGYFFVNYTNSAGTTFVVRYQANPPFATSTTANAASATTVLTIAQPFSNHNGGWIGFRPDDIDGQLYIAAGDGGSANDPGNRAQNINDLLGKMLRIDIDGPDNIPGNADDDAFPADAAKNYSIPASNPFAGATPGADEILFTGLRNPWRNSFDRATSDIYVADVGQNNIEEIDFVAGSAPTTPVKNFGWRCMEGSTCTGLSGCTCNATTLTLPISEYTHSFDGFSCSITGGYVYRGCTMPWLQGNYFFADYCSNQIRSFAYSGSGTAPASLNRTTELAPGGGLSIASVTSFGEDADGELYIVDQAGEVFKIVQTGRVAQDCNANGVDDALDVCRGTASDCNGNGVLDACSADPSPAIGTQPMSRTVCSGDSAVFSVNATTATGTITYQWKKNGSNITGETNNTLTINPATTADSGSYSCAVTVGCRTVDSAAVALVVQSGPTIITDPQAASICATQTAVFTVTDSAVPPASYQWLRNNTPITDGPTGNGSIISGSNTNTLIINNATTADQANYSCRLTNPCSTTTESAPLNVLCSADFDNSGGTPDASDIDAFFTQWLVGDASADADCSGGTPEAGDIDTFFTQWLAGGC